MSEENETPSPTTVQDDASALGPSNGMVDPRFQNTNHTRYCYTHYVDYHRCRYLLGEDESSGCNVFKEMYQRMCPNAWISRWDAQRENCIFPRNCTTELD